MKTRFVALAVAATMGLGSVSAFAQERHHDRRAEWAWQHQRADQYRHDWDHNRYEGRRYYAPSYGYRHDDDGGDVAGAVVLGALAGALLGQVADNTYSYSPPATYYAPPATYYTPPATYYTPPPTTYYGPGYGYYGY